MVIAVVRLDSHGDYLAPVSRHGNTDPIRNRCASQRPILSEGGRESRQQQARDSRGPQPVFCTHATFVLPSPPQVKSGRERKRVTKLIKRVRPRNTRMGEVVFVWFGYFAVQLGLSPAKWCIDPAPKVRNLSATLWVH